MEKQKPSFIYVSYIATSAKKIWHALITQDLIRQYWIDPDAGIPRVNVSDWKPGSRWEMQNAEDGSVNLVGKVLEVIPERRLVMTWARPSEESDILKHSRVSFDIEPYVDGTIRLTVKHEDLDKDPPMLEGTSLGWPKVLSNLKTFLETGRTLPARPRI